VNGPVFQLFERWLEGHDGQKGTEPFLTWERAPCLLATQMSDGRRSAAIMAPHVMAVMVVAPLVSRAIGTSKLHLRLAVVTPVDVDPVRAEG
jgi:hypothetical protein